MLKLNGFFFFFSLTNHSTDKLQLSAEPTYSVCARKIDHPDNSSEFEVPAEFLQTKSNRQKKI